MRRLHRPDMFQWSSFNEARNVDLHGTLLVLPSGNVAFDPLPLCEHDAAHITELGGVDWVNISNADHVRAAADFKRRFGARIGAPAAERELPAYAELEVDQWFAGDELFECGIQVVPMGGSKTVGEVAFVMPGGDTVVTGDLVRSHHGGALHLLPEAELSDRDAALASVRAMLDLPGLRHVVVGDGYPVFHRGREALGALVGQDHQLSLDDIADFCDRHQVPYARTAESQQMVIPRPDPKSPPLRILARPDRAMLTVALSVDVSQGPAVDAALAAACARVNARLFAGAWVHNCEAGQLFMRLTVPTEGVRYDDSALKWLFELVIATAEATLPNLLQAAGAPPAN